MFEEMKHLARTDFLTALPNHRYFQSTLSREVSRAQRHNHALSLLIIDFGLFKKRKRQVRAPGGRRRHSRCCENDTVDLPGDRFCCALWWRGVRRNSTGNRSRRCGPGWGTCPNEDRSDRCRSCQESDRVSWRGELSSQCEFQGRFNSSRRPSLIRGEEWRPEPGRPFQVSIDHYVVLIPP